MRKRFSTTDIDRFFTNLKEQPPIYNEEKVHQIINSPAAVARLKGKNKNLLKFTIMTTMIAIIISAVMFWQGVQEEIPKTKNQKPNSIVQTSGSMPKMNQEDNGAVTTNISSDDKINALADLNKATTEVETSNSKVSNNEQLTANNQPTGFEPAQPKGQKTIEFDTATIQPIDGNRFVLRLSKDELEKIGFEFTDTSIFFENTFNNNLYLSGYKKYKEKGIWKYDGKKKVLIDSSGFNYAYSELFWPDEEAYRALAKNHFDYYPICMTNTYFSNYFPVIREGRAISTFNMVNDTLLPIIFPSLDSVMAERIIWFVLTESLYNLLEEKHKNILDELIKYKKTKTYHPYKDLVVYKSPFQVDETKVIKLGNHELEKLGFKFYDDSTVYRGRWSNYGNSMVSGNNRSRWGVLDDLPKIDEKEGSIAYLASKNEGSLIGNGGRVNFLSWETDKEEQIIPTLIPVSVKVLGFNFNVIFWFLPTEGFFNALPDSIGNDLRKEYNYIIAEDKSTLVKPECKYFEECKNTLKVTGFKAFPNPANTNVTVSFTLPEAIVGRITLVDLAGRERQVLQPQTNYTKGSHQIDLDVSRVPEGIYLLTLYSDKGVQTQRLMVVR